MIGGGLSWAFDIASVDELRRRIAKKAIAGSQLGSRGEGKSEDDVEIEGLVVRALGRKEEQVQKRVYGDEGSEKRVEEADELREGN